MALAERIILLLAAGIAQIVIILLIIYGRYLLSKYLKNISKKLPPYTYVK